MVVTSNTSPITNLAAVGQLNVLRDLYGQIVIPQAVFDDLVLRGWGRNPGAYEVQSEPWISLLQVTTTHLVTQLLRETPKLDQGEAEAIILASELHSDLLLIDEKIGRTVARRLGVPTVGLLGVLLEAKTQSVIPLVRPVLDALRAGPKFRVSDELYREILRRANE
ncbi:MAG: DUF3368 domain-containing protein [Ktedonobacteraceae bacterium]|nr:DUF3368 domain-containing protein [Ktedonobacteraceae bacterium]